jgi:hypothetical protein
MPVFEVSFDTTLTTATANAPLASLKGDTGQETQIREIHIFQKTAGVAPNGLGLARSTALGTTPTTVAAVMRRPSSTLTSAVGVTAWAGVPTIGGVFRRFITGTAIGNGVIWAFDKLDPLILAEGDVATGELVIVNLYATAAPTYGVTIVGEV